MRKNIELVVRQAGEIILRAHSDKGVRQKTSKHDLVTRYDAEVQAFLRRELLSLLPQAGFFAEEDDGQARSAEGLRFIVDPIDGTMNFVRGLKRSCVSVALADAERVICGVIYNPYADELFTAEAGRGAFLNGAPIHASGCALDEAIVYAGTSPYYPPKYEQTFRLARSLMGVCADIRRSGSAALELCDVACGRAEAYFEALLSPWDYAAGALIVKEAGGLVGDMEGRPLSLTQKSSLAAGNGACYPALMALIRAARQQAPQKNGAEIPDFDE